MIHFFHPIHGLQRNATDVIPTKTPLTHSETQGEDNALPKGVPLIPCRQHRKPEAQKAHPEREDFWGERVPDSATEDDRRLSTQKIEDNALFFWQQQVFFRN
ncbi:hypothetical protein CDAR_252321 [Caerostris darwini]|uniref:Uncharacterized protein n=1 Tax=Caerostris darwini TaxID=1538125 RepID=A0AAV4QCW4_9ARAC|nr:hypothetical protein CDAR_252321 [Caerostris darwini]